MGKNDTLTRLRAQRDTLAARLAAIGKRLSANPDDATELVSLLAEQGTLQSAQRLLDERIHAAEVEARQAAQEAADSERQRALVAERKAYDAALKAVAGDVVKLAGSLGALTEIRQRLAVLGDFAADASIHLTPAVERALFYWRTARPSLLGLPERDEQAERRQADIADCAARLERATLRRDALKAAAREGFVVPKVDYEAATDAVRSAKRQLALASGQGWSAADESREERAESLVVIMRSPAEIEESLRRQNHAESVNRR